MDADRFSLKARRTTRIPLRIPVLVVIEDNGQSRSLDGWTMIVNVHGAKIECKRRMDLNDEVTIQVPFNGMSEKGKVVWSRPEPNASGNYEFGVELNQPDNLWGVGFPPSDWETGKGSKSDAARAAVMDLAPAGAIRDRHDGSEKEEPMMDAEPPAQSSVIEFEPSELMAAENPAPAMDLNAELSSFEQQEQGCLPAGLITEFTENEMTPQEEPIPMSYAGSDAAIVTGQTAPVEAAWTSAAELNRTALRPADPAPGPAPDYAPRTAGMGPINPTDKLFAFFNELVDSALQAKVLGLIDGVGKRIEQRVADIETGTLGRIEEQVQNTVQHQSEQMERRAAEYLTGQQQLLEQIVRDFLGASEQESRQRQQEQVERHQQTMRESAEVLTQANAERLEQRASELVATTQQGLRASMEQQLPAIEKDLLERCRVVGEKMMASQVEQWTLLFSDRVQTARQTLEQRLEETMNEVFARHAAALDARFEEQLTQAAARLEQQLNRIGTQVRQTYLRHIVTELGRTQQVWVQQAQRQLENLAAENFDRSRRNLSQYMKSFGESLIQQALSTEDVARERVQAAETQSQLPLDKSLQEVFSDPHDRER
jgi:hypothetical protein